MVISPLMIAQGISTISSLLSGGAKGVSSGNDTASSVKLSDAVAIAKRYDVKNITSKELAALSTELFDAGLINMQTHALLSTPLPAGQPAAVATAGPRNALADWQQEYQRAEQTTAQQAGSSYKRMALRVLENLNALRTLQQS